MVGKTYLGYEASARDGVIVSRQAQSIFASASVSTSVPQTSSQQNRRGGGRGGNTAGSQQREKVLVLTPMLEGVGIMNLKTGTLEQTLVVPELLQALGRAPPEVTVFSTPQQQGTTNTELGATQIIGKAPIAIGFSNGHVALFQSEPRAQTVKYRLVFSALGHKLDTGVLSLALDASGTVMISGGQDTDLTVWDVISQEPSFRLRGHRGGVVALRFVTKQAPTSGASAAMTDGSAVSTSAPVPPLEESDPTSNASATALNTRFVVSAAADGLIKVWDLQVQQCLQTIIASDSQVTSMTCDPLGQRIFVGLRENMVKVFSTVKTSSSSSKMIEEGQVSGAGDEVSAEEVEQKNKEALAAARALNEDDAHLFEHGIIQRKAAKAATGIVFSPDASFMAVVSATSVEIFQVHSADSVKKKAKRRQKRKRDLGEGETEGATTASDELSSLKIYHFDSKVRSVAFVPETTASKISKTKQRTQKQQGEDEDNEDVETVHFMVAFSDNRVESFEAKTMTITETGASVTTLTDKKLRHSLASGAHSADIKGLRLTSDDTKMVSMSEESLKVWRLKKKKQAAVDEFGEEIGGGFDDDDEDEGGLLTGGGAISDLIPLVSVPVVSEQNGGAAAEATCFEILPGNNLVAVGTTSGQLIILSLSSTQPVFSTTAHGGSINGMHMKYDGSGLLTIGVDRRVCHWELVLTGEGPEDVALELATDIELTHAPLYISTTADGKLCGIALQDNNIQILFLDTMKPFHVLYGHKLPVTCFAFSLDGNLIASVGIDKSLRFWGTDYGDCHKAIHAHDDYVTSVGFVAQTHYVFTASLDGTVKHWDGDNWTLIQRFHIHQHGIWSVALSSDGGFVVSAGTDRCIRTLMRTESIIYPHEEEEKMAQEAIDYEATKRDALNRLEFKETDVGVAGQKTVASNEAAEAIMTALDRVSVELQRQQAKKKGEQAGEPAIYFRQRTPWQYLWSTIESIKPSQMRHALSALTSVHAGVMLDYLERMIDEKAVLNYEWACKVLIPLVKPAPGSNSNVILNFAESSAGMIQLHRVRQKLTLGLQKETDRNGFTTAALGLVKKKLEEENKVKFFDLSKVQGHKKKFHSSKVPQ